MSKEKKILLTVGLPGSGKSTWADEFVKENPGWVKVSRDSFRFMLKNSPILDGKGETLITKLMRDSTKHALMAGFHVVMDNTHCKLKYINEVIQEFGEMASVEFKLFDTPLEVCLERDEARERKVGSAVIHRMHSDLETLKKSFDFSPVPKSHRLKKNYSQDWDPALPHVVITDIDGTVAHMNGKRGPFEWAKVGVDDPDISMIEILRAWKASGKQVLAVSGRDGSCREETEKWLRKHNVPFDGLFMRPAGDFRKDSLIKAEIYETQIKGNYNVVMIYDDRNQVVETWRKLGLKCAQVEPGDF